MKKEIYETLCQICGSEQVFCEESMSRHTTFRTGGPADILVTPKAEQISEILALCKEKQIPWTVIGNGSNLMAVSAALFWKSVNRCQRFLLREQKSQQEQVRCFLLSHQKLPRRN